MPSRPSTALNPKATPPLAPAKPISDKAWAAKADWRSTTKYPTTPARTATIVPATKAWRMNA